MDKKVLICGLGAWGSGLAQVLDDNHIDVTLYGNDSTQVKQFNQTHTNPNYFENHQFSTTLHAIDNLDSVNDYQYILLAVPTNAIESVTLQVVEKLTHPVVFINVAKGFHPVTHKGLTQVISEAAGEKASSVVSLIGPSLAIEVVQRLLTSVCAVSEDIISAIDVQHMFSNDYFRVYTSDDVIGSEAGVAIKNILALASGIITGLGQGNNARAALMTRGLVEMRRYGVALGGNPNTYFGLTGVGDLIVTCTSSSSRNYSAGYGVGKANSAKEFWENNTKTVEGVKAVKVIYDEAKRRDISMPICDAVYKIFYEDAIPSETINTIMHRPLKKES